MNWSNEKSKYITVNKIILIVIATAFIVFSGVYLYKKDSTSGLVERCPEYVKYEPVTNAWYWQIPAQNDYFPTKEEALNNCINFWESN